MINQVGIGFRRDFADEFMSNKDFNPDFIKLAPENWIGRGGFLEKDLR